MTNRTALALVRDDSEPERRPAFAEPAAAPDVATITAVTNLLSQLERTARAQRPIVLHTPAAAPVPAPQPGHPGISVTVPGPPAAVAFTRPRRLYTLPEVLLRCGATGFLVGLATFTEYYTHSLSLAAMVTSGSTLLVIGSALRIGADDDRSQTGNQG